MSNLEKYNWRFDEEITKQFDSHVVKSVPLYGLFHKNIIELSGFFAQIGSNIVDIGTSTGTLIAELHEKNKHRKINSYGIDIEKSMIEECEARYGQDIKFELSDALDYNYTNASIVASVLSFQFMEKQNRVRTLKKIYEEMNSDGVFFLVEKVKTEILDIHDAYGDIYYDFKRESLTDEEILDKNSSLRGVMKPITLNDNMNNLRMAGFDKIDVFMKFNNFVGILAIK